MLEISRFRNILIKSLLLLLLLAFAPGDIPKEMLDALRTGNSIQLAQYFSTSIELAIPGKEDIYSNKQAELIMKDFFTKHVPSGFSILHQGGKEGSQYAIGLLTTSAGRYRVTLLIKMKENKPFIHQLRFEQENAD